MHSIMPYNVNHNVLIFCLQITDMPTCTTDSGRDDFDFDIQNVKPAQSQLITETSLVSLSVYENKIFETFLCYRTKWTKIMFAVITYVSLQHISVQ